jgi:hypothetical protein
MSRTGKDELIVRALVELVLPPAQSIQDAHTGIHRKWKTIRACGTLFDEAGGICANTAKLNAVIVERLTLYTIAVRWSDSRSGVYGEQTWRVGQARCHSHCAATGLPIQPGDVVYKPMSCQWKVPFNRHQMILASAVDSRVDGYER